MSKGTLIAFGCSNTAGTEAIHDYDEGDCNWEANYRAAYPRYLADLLEYDYLNYAYPGASNQEIASSVFNYINSSDFAKIRNPFIVVGWTDDNRINVLSHRYTKTTASHFSSSKPVEDLFLSKKSPCRTISTATVCSTLKQILAKEKLSIYDRLHLKTMEPITPEAVVAIGQHIFNSPGHNEVNFFIKFATASFLEQCKIPYITLQTLWVPYNFKYFSLNTDKNLLPFSKNNLAKFNYLEQFKHLGTSKSQAHLKEPAHKEVGKYLYEYIINNKLI